MERRGFVCNCITSRYRGFAGTAVVHITLYIDRDTQVLGRRQQRLFDCVSVRLFLIMTSQHSTAIKNVQNLCCRQDQPLSSSSLPTIILTPVPRKEPPSMPMNVLGPDLSEPALSRCWNLRDPCNHRCCCPHSSRDAGLLDLGQESGEKARILFLPDDRHNIDLDRIRLSKTRPQQQQQGLHMSKRFSVGQLSSVQVLMGNKCTTETIAHKEDNSCWMRNPWLSDSFADCPAFEAGGPRPSDTTTKLFIHCLRRTKSSSSFF